METKHPLALFPYCPKCGSSSFLVNDERSKRCSECGFVYYLNASAAVAAMIVNARGELLVATRANEPARGTFDLPGGFVDPGESVDDGLRREILEETSATVAQAKYLFSIPNKYLFSGFEVPTADSFFLCRLQDENVVRAGDDAAALQWVALSDLRPEAFGLTSIRKAVERLLAERERILHT